MLELRKYVRNVLSYIMSIFNLVLVVSPLLLLILIKNEKLVPVGAV
jgi:hypothetical protein